MTKLARYIYFKISNRYKHHNHTSQRLAGANHPSVGLNKYWAILPKNCGNWASQSISAGAWEQIGSVITASCPAIPSENKFLSLINFIVDKCKDFINRMFFKFRELIRQIKG